MDPLDPDAAAAAAALTTAQLAELIGRTGFAGDAGALAERLAKAHGGAEAGAGLLAEEWLALLTAAELSAAADSIAAASATVEAMLLERQKRKA